jgi:hypothetical protein
VEDSPLARQFTNEYESAETNSTRRTLASNSSL